MTGVHGDSIWVLFLSAGGLLVIGIILLKFGLWSRRRGDTPYCRKCGYNLTGTEADRCSECGTTLTADAIVHGRRHRRPLVVAAGALMILLALVPVWSGSRQVNWYRLRPTAWVISDFSSTAPAIQKKAWNELMYRARAGKFSQAQQDRFIKLCLAEQVVLPTGSSFTAEAFKYLRGLWGCGDLSSEQGEQFFEQMVLVCDVEVKSTANGTCMYNTDLVMRDVSHVLSRIPRFWFRIRQATAIDRTEPAEWSQWTSKTINAFRWEDAINGRSLKAPPGDHTLRYFVEVEVYTDGPVGDLEASRRCHSFRVEDHHDFVITPDGTLKQIVAES